MVDQDYEGLSDEGRQLDDRLRNTVADLTGAPVRRGRRSGPGRVGFALAIFAVFVAVLIGALLTRSDDDRAIVETAPTPVPAGGLVPTPGPAPSSQSSVSSHAGPAHAYCGVRDVVQAYYGLLSQGEPGGTYQVCSGRATTLREVFALLEAIVGVSPTVEVDPSLIRPNEQRVVAGSSARIASCTGWRPRIELRKSLEDICAYWDERVENEPS